MNGFEYTIKKLDNTYNKDSFDSGIPQLDRYLAQQAGQDMKRHVAITYVLNKLDANEIIGYYTLSSSSIELKNLPEQEIKKFPKYPLLPATLIGRLAIDKKHQRKGAGQLLLTHALKMSLENSQNIAAMAVIVEAKNETAIKFYQHHGFIQFSDSQSKLFLPMATIKKMGF